MNILDIILGFFLLWGVVKGFRNGLIIELASLAALILGLYGALRFSYYTSDILSHHFELKTQTLHIISFAITFIIIVVLVHMLAKALDKLVKAIALGFFNRFLGILFGLIKMAFILSILLIPVNALNRKTHFLPEKTVRASVLYGPVSRFAPTLFSAFRFDVIAPLRSEPQKNEPVTL
jgi:membrane protein required for colicin V production